MPLPTFRKLIAVIDDDPSVRNALSRQMRAAGFRTMAFQSAEEFLLVAATCGAVMVISDIHLGSLSGIDLAVHPQITQMQLPVILISGSIDPAITTRAQDVCAAFLQKPIPPGILLETVIDTVGTPIAETGD